jgi:hypothetical protein
VAAMRKPMRPPVSRHMVMKHKQVHQGQSNVTTVLVDSRTTWTTSVSVGLTSCPLMSKADDAWPCSGNAEGGAIFKQ